MRIYVQKERGGELNVVISESDDDLNGCVRFLLRCVRQWTYNQLPLWAGNACVDRMYNNDCLASPLFGAVSTQPLCSLQISMFSARVQSNPVCFI